MFSSGSSGFRKSIKLSESNVEICSFTGWNFCAFSDSNYRGIIHCCCGITKDVYIWKEICRRNQTVCSRWTQPAEWFAVVRNYYSFIIIRNLLLFYNYLFYFHRLNWQNPRFLSYDFNYLNRVAKALETECVVAESQAELATQQPLRAFSLLRRFANFLQPKIHALLKNTENVKGISLWVFRFFIFILKIIRKSCL